MPTLTSSLPCSVLCLPNMTRLSFSLTHESTLYCQKNSSASCLAKRFIVYVLSLHQTLQSSSSLLLRFILFPALQATIQLHLLSVIMDVAEAGSAVVVVIVNVPSHHYISPPVADLNARSVIVLVIMLTNATNCYDDLSPSVSPTTLLHSYENSPADLNWYVNSEATHHLTADMTNLVVHS